MSRSGLESAAHDEPHNESAGVLLVAHFSWESCRNGAARSTPVAEQDRPCAILVRNKKDKRGWEFP